MPVASTVVVVKTSIRYPVLGRLASWRGLDGFLDARLQPGISLVLEAIQYTQHLKYAALAIVGEGN